MAAYNDSVFINCPFDDQYLPIFHALVFAVHDCGYVARCAQEVLDAGQVRIEKIQQIIEECRFGIHDISRTELDPHNNLPRFNMPLELGLFLGAKRYGTGVQQQKSCAILDTEKWRFQMYCSDIAGQDIFAHAGEPARAIKAVRNWLQAHNADVRMPSGGKIAERHRDFSTALPVLCDTFHYDVDDLTFVDYQNMAVEWQLANGW